MDGIEPLSRVDVLSDDAGTRLSLSVMDEATSTTQVEATMTRGERLWLVGVLLRGLWRP